MYMYIHVSAMHCSGWTVCSCRSIHLTEWTYTTLPCLWKELHPNCSTTLEQGSYCKSRLKCKIKDTTCIWISQWTIVKYYSCDIGSCSGQSHVSKHSVSNELVTSICVLVYWKVRELQDPLCGDGTNTPTVHLSMYMYVHNRTCKCSH